jgi:hypothetical protein
MPRPTVPAVTELLYDDIGISQPGDETRGWPFLIFLGAVGHALGELHDVVRDTPDGPGWSVLLDPDRCPAWALPWLAQFAGVTLTPDADEATWRSEITNPSALRRGTPAALREAAQRTLTGGKRFTLYERVYSAYRDVAITYAAETPDPAATERAILSQKVAGRLFKRPSDGASTIRVDRGWSVAQFEAAYAGRTVADFEADFATVDDFETRLPA